MITDEQLIWLAIVQSPGIGAKRFWQLYEVLQNLSLSFTEFWNLSEPQVKEIGVQSRILTQFIQHRQTYNFSKVKNRLEAGGVRLVISNDPLYPDLLCHVPDRPPVLFVQGELHTQLHNTIAVVGTRRVTSYGRSVTQSLVKDLTTNHWSIISGFMYGVDAVAHKTAIEEGGYTIGVMGFGHEHTYPQSHHQLRRQILEAEGALISEYFPDVPPIPGQFPARNRIVAGMSRGVLVTEAAAESGSKITAQYAVEYGRDVFAVPGMITSPFSEGTKDLINSGAKLVTSAKDILDEYQVEEHKTKYATQQPVQCNNTQEQKIVEILAVESMDSDGLAKELNIATPELLVTLTELEIRGIIKQKLGQYSLHF